jgi:hypothetical protein
VLTINDKKVTALLKVVKKRFRRYMRPVFDAPDNVAWNFCMRMLFNTGWRHYRSFEFRLSEGFEQAETPLNRHLDDKSARFKGKE